MWEFRNQETEEGPLPYLVTTSGNWEKKRSIAAHYEQGSTTTPLYAAPKSHPPTAREKREKEKGSSLGRPPATSLFGIRVDFTRVCVRRQHDEVKGKRNSNAIISEHPQLFLAMVFLFSSFLMSHPRGWLPCLPLPSLSVSQLCRRMASLPPCRCPFFFGSLLALFYHDRPLWETKHAAVTLGC